MTPEELNRHAASEADHVKDAMPHAYSEAQLVEYLTLAGLVVWPCW
jgi:hypothetical protein